MVRGRDAEPVLVSQFNLYAFLCFAAFWWTLFVVFVRLIFMEDSE